MSNFWERHQTPQFWCQWRKTCFLWMTYFLGAGILKDLCVRCFRLTIVAKTAKIIFLCLWKMCVKLFRMVQCKHYLYFFLGIWVVHSVKFQISRPDQQTLMASTQPERPRTTSTQQYSVFVRWFWMVWPPGRKNEWK